MRKTLLFLFLLVILSSCTSGDNTDSKENEFTNEEKLSREKARELIQEEIDKTKDDVGGLKKDIKEFTVQTISEKDGIYTIKYTWSGKMQQPSVPPLEGEEYKGSYEVTNDTAELKVQQKENKWQIIP